MPLILNLHRNENGRADTKGLTAVFLRRWFADWSSAVFLVWTKVFNWNTEKPDQANELLRASCEDGDTTLYE